MYRYDVINELIKLRGYKRYLEIGTQADKCLEQIRCDHKTGVDIKPFFHDEKNCNEFYEMSSDQFFFRNMKEFDIIFIDGLHEYMQVRSDIANSLLCLSPDGTIVVHDCNPQEEINQRVPMPHVGSWNGDVWRAWVFFRHIKPLTMYVIDTDEGCGIIQRGWQQPLDEKHNLTFEEFDKDRVGLLNLISLEQWKKDISV